MAGWHSRTRARGVGERRARAQASAGARARDSCATNHGTRCGSMAGGKSMPTVAAKIQHQFLATHTLLTCPTSLPKKPRVQRKFAKRAHTHAHANKRAHAVTRKPDPLFPSRTHTHVRARTHARALAHTCTRHQSHSHLLKHEAVPIPAQRPVRLSGTHVCLVRVRHRVQMRCGARRGSSRSAAARSWHFLECTNLSPSVNDPWRQVKRKKESGFDVCGGV
jgi:hypothetical protein